MYNVTSNDELLLAEAEKMRTGNFNDYQRFYDLSRNYVYKIINDVLGDPSTSEQVLVDTYNKIYSMITTLVSVQGFYAWLSRIASGMALEYLKSNSKTELVIDFEEEEEGFVFDKLSDDTDAFVSEEMLQDAEIQRMVTETLDKMPQTNRLVVQYYYYEGYSVDEISTMLSADDKTVRQVISGTKKELMNICKNSNKGSNGQLCTLSQAPLYWLAFKSSLDLMAGGGVAGGIAGASIAGIGGGAAGSVAGIATGVNAGSVVASVNAGVAGSNIAGTSAFAAGGSVASTSAGAVGAGGMGASSIATSGVAGSSVATGSGMAAGGAAAGSGMAAGGAAAGSGIVAGSGAAAGAAGGAAGAGGAAAVVATVSKVVAGATILGAGGATVYNVVTQNKGLSEIQKAYYNYISEEIAPKDGVMNLDETDHTCAYEDGESWLTPYGILSADIRDYDDDKIEDMLLLYYDTEKGADGSVLKAAMYTFTNKDDLDKPKLADTQTVNFYANTEYFDSIKHTLNEDEYSVNNTYVTTIKDSGEEYIVFENSGYYPYGDFAEGLSWFDVSVYQYNKGKLDLVASATGTNENHNFELRGCTLDKGEETANVKLYSYAHNSAEDELAMYSSEEFKQAFNNFFENNGINLQYKEYGKRIAEGKNLFDSNISLSETTEKEGVTYANLKYKAKDYTNVRKHITIPENPVIKDKEKDDEDTGRTGSVLDGIEDERYKTFLTELIKDEGEFEGTITYNVDNSEDSNDYDDNDSHDDYEDTEEAHRDKLTVDISKLPEEYSVDRGHTVYVTIYSSIPGYISCNGQESDGMTTEFKIPLTDNGSYYYEVRTDNDMTSGYIDCQCFRDADEDDFSNKNINNKITYAKSEATDYSMLNSVNLSNSANLPYACKDTEKGIVKAIELDLDYNENDKELLVISVEADGSTRYLKARLYAIDEDGRVYENSSTTFDTPSIQGNLDVDMFVRDNVLYAYFAAVRETNKTRYSTLFMFNLSSGYFGDYRKYNLSIDEENNECYMLENVEYISYFEGSMQEYESANIAEIRQQASESVSVLTGNTDALSIIFNDPKNGSYDYNYSSSSRLLSISRKTDTEYEYVRKVVVNIY